MASDMISYDMIGSVQHVAIVSIQVPSINNGDIPTGLRLNLLEETRNICLCVCVFDFFC